MRFMVTQRVVLHVTATVNASSEERAREIAAEYTSKGLAAAVNGESRLTDTPGIVEVSGSLPDQIDIETTDSYEAE